MRDLGRSAGPSHTEQSQMVLTPAVLVGTGTRVHPLVGPTGAINSKNAAVGLYAAVF